MTFEEAMKVAHEIVKSAATDGWVEVTSLSEIAFHLLKGGTVAVKDGPWASSIERLPKPKSH